MRLNPSSGMDSAADIVNNYREEELANLIYLYGEEKLSRRIASAIVKARSGGRIESSKVLADIIFNDRKESNPCSLCAKMRKGSLNEYAKNLGCNKIAYAHHKDDLIETMFLSLIYEGRFHCFSPVTYLDRMDLTVIRPLMYAPEMDVIGFTNKYELPVAKSQCPVDGHTKREYVKQLIRQLNEENPGCKERFFRAIINGGF